MLALIKSFGLKGLDGFPVQAEIDMHAGMPTYDIVGLADTAVKESKERVRSAMKNSGYSYPVVSVVINLAPADVKKEGTLYDLPIALGMLAASKQIPYEKLLPAVILGELSLNGEIRKVNGLLPMLISARQQGESVFVIPRQNAEEAAFIEGATIYPVSTLREAVDLLTGAVKADPLSVRSWQNDLSFNHCENDFKYIKGQFAAKRAMEIAVAGGHNIIMIGPPGAGKTMLARAVPSIMPDMTFEEALEVAKIHSVAGQLDGFVYERPFRTPHHSSTMVALTGGGNKARPGEISMAHNGVLFLDELPEYNRQALETLRQPLEDGVITVARNAISVTYPADFMLIASMNPCPCGNYGSATAECRCSASQIHNYLNKLSGPLLDRIDIHVEVDNVTYGELQGEEVSSESSEVIRERVNKARKVQLARLSGNGRRCNAQMTPSDIKKYCRLNAECSRLLEDSFERLGLSARAYNRILKVARTIADLDGAENITVRHIAESLQYRALDRKYRV